MGMLLLTLSAGFVFGALTIIAVEVLGVLFFISRLKRRVKAEEDKSKSQYSPPVLGDVDLSYLNKQGAVWVLEPEKVPIWPADRAPRDQKRKNFVEVTPVRKSAKIKNQSLIITESDGSLTEIQLKGCTITAVSATNLPSRKWAKRYPIKVESHSSAIYRGSKIFYIYLETAWEKESWCKALRLVSCNDKEKFEWYTKINLEFHSYLTSLNAGYPSFLKPSAGFCAEPIDKSIKLEGSSSKVRHFLKKLAKKASRSGVENKGSWTLIPGREERNFSEKSRSLQESVFSSGLMKAAPRAPSYVEDDTAAASSSSYSHSGGRGPVSMVSDVDLDEKIIGDEGTICLNLLISRLFFDAKSNAEMRNSIQARIQQRMLSNMRSPSYVGEVICTGVNPGDLPPFIHAMRVLPLDMNDVWAFDIDIEYAGGLVLDIETRLEVRELDFEEGIREKNLESASAGLVTSDLLEEFEHFGKQLKLSDGPVDELEQKDEGDLKLNGIKGSTSTTQASTNVSRWKSILNSVAKHVSQVPLSLGIRIASLRGTMRLHIKPPPSDQLWFGFTSMPDVDFQLESFVGEHKISSGHVALFLINKFKAAIRETLVLPNCESLCIPWMLAEKDDWIPQKAGPFMWTNREDVSEASIVRKASICQPGEATARAFEVNGVECSNQPVRKSSDASASPGDLSTSNDKSLQELRTPLLENAESQEICQWSGEENLENQSSSRSPNSTYDQNRIVVEGDDARPKQMGTRARMLGLRKKMGEKLEEKRRHFEEKGKHIVERMRGPQN